VWDFIPAKELIEKEILISGPKVTTAQKK